MVRLGGYKVRKDRCNVADAHDAAHVFMYRDSSIAPLLGMRRRPKSVMDVLDSMIRNGASLSRSVELTVQFILLRWRIWMLFRVVVLVIFFVL